MSNRFRHSASALLSVAAIQFAASPCLAAWQNNAPFGATLQGDLFSPSTPGPSPAVVVAIHYCTGNKSVVHGWFESAAEKNGFYIIAPDAGKQCFDSSASRDGDKAAIVKMVDYVIAQKSVDKTRVFAAGLSSGGCMTNTLLALYPEVFAGGAAMPGFPAGGWPAGDTTCTKCSSNPPSTDGKYWADIVTKVNPYNGTRPCVQQWVGGGDEYKFNAWLPAVAAQFQTLMGLGAGTSGTGAPSGWTRTEYKDSAGNVRLQTNLGPSSQKHDLSSANLFGNVVSFLGLDKPSGSCGSTTSSGTGGAGGASSSSSVAAGGSVAGGGKSSTGGTSNSGGKSSAGGSGPAAGGASSSTTSSAPTGGAKTTTGGTSSVTTTSTGGAKTSGTATVSTGGTSASSTIASNRGGTESSNSVGTTGNGGSATSSTTSNTTSNTASGGSSNATSSSSNTGNVPATTGGGSPLPEADGGCRVARGERPLGTAGLLLVALGMLVRRRRRSV
ncbi:MAG TPA: PHB depolymerase family esterase [Polyangiaceae bacterium]